jgi:hypothetical protein
MKKLLLIGLPALLVLGGGGVFGAAKMGLVQIPGLSPAKKKALAANQYAADSKAAPPHQKQEKPRSAQKADAPLKKKPLPPTEDAAKGRAKLASLWNEMKVEDLLAITKEWKIEELAAQLEAMDGEVVAKYLSSLAKADPKRASSLSKAIQKLAAKVEPGPEEV